LLCGSLSVAFRGVQQAGEAGSIELVECFAKMGLLGSTDFDEQVGYPSQEFELELVNLELFVIELGGKGHVCERSRDRARKRALRWNWG
jgi:hypothetical protein